MDRCLPYPSFWDMLLVSPLMLWCHIQTSRVARRLWDVAIEEYVGLAHIQWNGLCIDSVDRRKCFE